MKTLLTAVLLVLASIASLGQGTPVKVITAEPHLPQASHAGRYQLLLYQGEMPRFNTYLLDTETGKTWMMKGLPDGTDFWEPILKVDNDAEELTLALKHPKSLDSTTAVPSK